MLKKLMLNCKSIFNSSAFSGVYSIPYLWDVFLETSLPQTWPFPYSSQNEVEPIRYDLLQMI